MPYVIGTAGHIDHGKTSLVKALTGIDTDRLKEEKERGISIELGFAYLDLPDGTRVGIVDVPGHERFIRTMLAGAHGIDLVLFTVAADDGVMPQTEEHFDIVHLLGIERAIFVVTKTDLVPDSRFTQVQEEIQILAAGTAFERSPILPFSSATGRGLVELRAEIARALTARVRRAPSGYFRLPIDRVFTLQGHGLIVTGTAVAGEVAVGDHLRGLPGDQSFRVRSIQVHNQAVDRAEWGQRVALNLTAQDRPMLVRGSVLCNERLAITSARFDAWIEARTPETVSVAIKNHQHVRLHLGTAERLAKIVLLDAEEQLRSGQTAFCQIVVAEPLNVLRGDRFVIRDETARHTLGGGVVVHPAPRVHRRREVARVQKLQTLRDGSPEAVVEIFIDDHEEFAVTLDSISRFLNETADRAQSIAAAAPGLRAIALEGEQVYTTPKKWQGLQEVLLRELEIFHRSHPLAPGQEMEELRERLPWSLSSRVFRACVTALEHEAVLAREGGLLRLPTHTVALQAGEQEMAERIVSLLGATPLTPPDLKEIQRELGDANVGAVARVLQRNGTVVRVSGDLYFLADALSELQRTVRDEFSAGDVLTPAMFRDRFGTSRKYAIPLLEYLDREGITQRTGDIRRLKPPRTAARV